MYYNSMRISHKRSPQYDKKSRYQESTILNKDRLMRINKSILMIINKQLLLRMSHQSKANLNLRTQSTTIPNTLIAKGLYIYKKWNCVESLTISGSWLTSANSVGMIGTSIKHMPIEHTQI